MAYGTATAVFLLLAGCGGADDLHEGAAGEGSMNLSAHDAGGAEGGSSGAGNGLLSPSGIGGNGSAIDGSGYAGNPGAAISPGAGVTGGDTFGEQSLVDAGSATPGADSGAPPGMRTVGAMRPPLAGNCTAQTPPSSVRTMIVTPDKPVAVPNYFMGMHIGLHVPAWKAGAYSAIPAPTYAYGYSRTLKVEVDGKEERGFWLNIETAPGVYDWQYMDKWMTANRGHPVIWLISGMPSFYAKYPGEPTRWPSWPGSASPPSDAAHAALKRYAQAVKARYGDQIAAFEVWNEPTLPWTGSATNYDERWSPQWGRANLPQNPTPFFSGSASDLANIAFTLNQANLGVPVLGAAFVDQWGTHQHTVTRFLNAPITVPGGFGTGKDHIQGLSMHYYDYSYSPTDILRVIDGYREKLRLAGVPDMPLWGTETGGEVTGRFGPNDYRAPLGVQRWTLLAAAKGIESLVLYGHVSEDDLTENLGNPIDNPEVVQSLREAGQIMGRTICNAAVLTDNRVWVTSADGMTWLK